MANLEIMNSIPSSVSAKIFLSFGERLTSTIKNWVIGFEISLNIYIGCHFGDVSNHPTAIITFSELFLVKFNTVLLNVLKEDVCHLQHELDRFVVTKLSHIKDDSEMTTGRWLSKKHRIKHRSQTMNHWSLAKYLAIFYKA